MLPSFSLTLSWRRPLSYRNQFIDLLCKSMDWFLYDNGLRHERVNYPLVVFTQCLSSWIFFVNRYMLCSHSIFFPIFPIVFQIFINLVTWSFQSKLSHNRYWKATFFKNKYLLLDKNQHQTCQSYSQLWHGFSEKKMSFWCLFNGNFMVTGCSGNVMRFSATNMKIFHNFL